MLSRILIVGHIRALLGRFVFTPRRPIECVVFHVCPFAGCPGVDLLEIEDVS
jgi:hypothetical protein